MTEKAQSTGGPGFSLARRQTRYFELLWTPPQGASSSSHIEVTFLECNCRTKSLLRKFKILLQLERRVRGMCEKPCTSSSKMEALIDDPAVWGKNFPMQYDLYLRTMDMQRTRYGGSEALPHSPTQGDPREIVTSSKIEADPRLKEMWAGFSFSKD
jgi:hypothetical protein